MVQHIDTLRVIIVDTDKAAVYKSIALYVSGMALIVSIASLIFVSRYNRNTYKMNHNHYRLITKPNIEFFHRIVIFENDFFMEELIIKNTGLGPAIIKSVTYALDNVKYSKISDIYQERCPDTVKHIIPTDSEEVVMPGGYSLSPKDDLVLYSIKYAAKLDSCHKKTMQKIKLQIDYCGVYSGIEEHLDMYVRNND